MAILEKKKILQKDPEARTPKYPVLLQRTPVPPKDGEKKLARRSLSGRYCHCQHAITQVHSLS